MRVFLAQTPAALYRSAVAPVAAAALRCQPCSSSFVGRVIGSLGAARLPAGARPRVSMQDALGASPFFVNVDDICTRENVITCSPETSVDDALELLVVHHVTGLPVVDDSNKVVGVVSDFDMLALEGISQKDRSAGLFPEASADWNTFFEVQKLITKNAGKIVRDVMTADPICVRPATSVADAANLLLRMKIRRLPVVDENGRLLGIVSRGNIIRAALEARKAAKLAQAA